MEAICFVSTCRHVFDLNDINSEGVNSAHKGPWFRCPKCGAMNQIDCAMSRFIRRGKGQPGVRDFIEENGWAL